MHYLALVWLIPQVRLPRQLAGESACPTFDRRRYQLQRLHGTN
jgi:hypothetical protein